ncbi:MAG TPA: asparagine synthase (glutamine-hydrolyzing) [Acidobacteriaceae bacterium]|nr:asparagine synthase (glutamine-hydrolyzing) [Acidobacteriaceae bacterium]
MCGIAGFVSTEPAAGPSAADAIRNMTDCMKLRGPDAEGIWHGASAVLGHRRLAIQDLEARSNQPMHWSGSETATARGNLTIVFNGEIYNFRELRDELASQGVMFRTTSDTEVLLALYARDRERMLPRLRGMFAFAIWNEAARELFLARDPYGIKPLYYAETPRGVVFASQVKAILASGLISPTAEPAGLAGFYLWGSVPEPWTLYRGIHALPCGSWLLIRNGKPVSQPTVWSDIRESWRRPQDRISQAELQERVRAAVLDSARAHLVSDVPVSVFLSSGIDSSAIAGLISQLGSRVEGITVGFDEFSSRHEDEVPIAASIAQHYGLPHHVRRITRAEFEADIPAILSAMDQPSIDGVNTWFAAKAAAERGYKVVLSGVGGDELFYGYSLMRELPVNARRGRIASSIPGSRPLVRAAIAAFANGRHPKLHGIADFMHSLEGVYFLKRCLFLPDELPALIGPELAREGLERLATNDRVPHSYATVRARTGKEEQLPPGMSPAKAVTDVAGVCLLDSTHYLRNQLLRDSDWASMAHSLELRTPLVDATLLRTLSTVHSGFANGAGKRMLAHSPASPLPASIVNRPKSGFAVPMTEWLAAMGERHWQNVPMLAAPQTPWTRRWARVVLEEGFQLAVR